MNQIPISQNLLQNPNPALIPTEMQPQAPVQGINPSQEEQRKNKFKK